MHVIKEYTGEYILKKKTCFLVEESECVIFSSLDDLKRRGRSRAAASANQGGAGSRWGLNRPVKTAADDSGSRPLSAAKFGS